VSKEYDGWTVKHFRGYLMPWWFNATKSRVIKGIGKKVWEQWKKMGTKIVKVKLVEVK